MGDSIVRGMSTALGAGVPRGPLRQARLPVSTDDGLDALRGPGSLPDRWFACADGTGGGVDAALPGGATDRLSADYE
jgi:hypothetical protein